MADTNIHTVREEIYCSWGGKRNSWGECTQGPGLLCECAWFTVHRLTSSQSPLKVDLGTLLNWKNIHLTRTQTFIWVVLKRAQVLKWSAADFSPQLVSLFRSRISFFFKRLNTGQHVVIPMPPNPFGLSLVYTGSSSLKQNTLQVNLPAVKHKDGHLMTKA